MEEEKQKSVSEIIEDIKTEICNDYCKYGQGLRNDDLPEECDGCPLNRL
jgi:hypothetical protein